MLTLRYQPGLIHKRSRGSVRVTRNEAVITRMGHVDLNLTLDLGIVKLNAHFNAVLVACLSYSRFILPIGDFQIWIVQAWSFKLVLA